VWALCIAIINKKNAFFFTKSENRRAEQFLSVELVPVGGKRR
jgi:hypothetical protein